MSIDIYVPICEKADGIFIRPIRTWLLEKEINQCEVKYFFWDGVRDEGFVNYQVIEDMVAPDIAAQIRKRYTKKVIWLESKINTANKPKSSMLAPAPSDNKQAGK